MKKNAKIVENIDVKGNSKKSHIFKLCKSNENNSLKTNDKGITMLALIVTVGLIAVLLCTVIVCIKANMHEQKALNGALDTIDEYIYDTPEDNQNEM